MSTSDMSTSGMSTNAADTFTSSSKFFSITYPRSIEAAVEKLQPKLSGRDSGVSFSSKSEIVEWIMNALHETGSVGGHRGTKVSKGTNVKGEQAYMYTGTHATVNKNLHNPRFIASFLDLTADISLVPKNLQGTCFASLQSPPSSADDNERKKISEARKAACALVGYMALAYYLNVLSEKLNLKVDGVEVLDESQSGFIDHRVVDEFAIGVRNDGRKMYHSVAVELEEGGALPLTEKEIEAVERKVNATMAGLGEVEEARKAQCERIREAIGENLEEVSDLSSLAPDKFKTRFGVLARLPYPLSKKQLVGKVEEDGERGWGQGDLTLVPIPVPGPVPVIDRWK